MKFAELHRILNEIGLSAEQVAPALGISNMTIRRWRRAQPSATVPKDYERLLVGGLQELLLGGRYTKLGPEAAALLAASWSEAFQASAQWVALAVESPVENERTRTALLSFVKEVGRVAGTSKAKTSRAPIKSPDVRSVLNPIFAELRLNPRQKLLSLNTVLFLLSLLNGKWTLSERPREIHP